MQSDLKNRDVYLNKLISFQDKEPIKIVTGIRRCGKSKLLDLMIEHLQQEGIEKKQIVKINFESFAYQNMTGEQLYYYVAERAEAGKRLYIFLDEPHIIEGWERVVNSFRVDFDCDIYITGSNAHMLSSEYSTYLSGRYVEIKMLPLSFKEFLDFNNFKVIEEPSVLGGTIKRCYYSDGKPYELKTVFDSYLRYGGMPGLADIGLSQENVSAMLDGIYNTVITNDILERDSFGKKRKITDPVLLKRIATFLADNIGKETSYNSITNTFKTEKLADQNGRLSDNHKIKDYVDALVQAFFFYEAKRYDIVGKSHLKTNGKFYIVDLGFKNLLLDYRNIDRGFALENIVYLELLRRGYAVSVGKIDTKEIDFRAVKNDEILYIQVTEEMQSISTKERELAPLVKVNDNYTKTILTTENESYNIDGIKVINIIDWLLD